MIDSNAPVYRVDFCGCGNTKAPRARRCRECYEASRARTACIESDCSSLANVKGYCSRHFRRGACSDCGLPIAKREGRCRDCYDARRRPPDVCTTDGCSTASHTAGKCLVHYNKVPCEECGGLSARGLCWNCFSGRSCSQPDCADEHFGNGLCSRHYKQIWLSENPGYNDKYKRRRRAREANVESEPYDRVAVFVRDGWTCQLCGEPVDPDLRAPDPASPSIDHVVPISLGGPDTFANVQLAHLGCNAAKGNRVQSERTQLRLVK